MDFIKVEHSQNVAVVTISRGKANAINDQLVDELLAVISDVTDDEQVRAIVLASDRPKFFCTGFDFNEVFQYGREKMAEFFGRYVDLYERIYTLPKPVIGAVSGHAFAGGAILALACDFRIMAEGEFGFALNEVNLGVVPPAGAAAMAIEAVGFAKAREIILSGDIVTTAQALDMGLAKELAPPELVLERAFFHALAFAEKPAAAFAGAKKLFRGIGCHYNVGEDKRNLRETLDIWFSPEAERLKKALLDSRRE